MPIPNNITNSPVSIDQHHIDLLRLSLIDRMGHAAIKKLVSYLGGPEAVLKASKKDLMSVDGIGESHVKLLAQAETEALANQVAEESAKAGHHLISYLDKAYPARLKHCMDAPVIMHYDGDSSALNPARSVSIVGTRNSTRYGEEFTERFVQELVHRGVVVNSGLAYGIDACAHKSTLKHAGQTVAVVAHGLDRVSPALHRDLARQIKQDGGLLTEHRLGVKVEKGYFPMRNRIVAGMSDAVIVVESDIRGGSLITAMLANDYNRDVYALPGRWDDRFSRGCNALIQKNQAHILNDIDEFLRMMAWDDESERPKAAQLPLFTELEPKEKNVFSVLTRTPKTIDVIANECQMPISEVSATLLGLEFKGLVRMLPGKQYISA